MSNNYQEEVRDAFLRTALYRKIKKNGTEYIMIELDEAVAIAYMATSEYKEMVKKNEKRMWSPEEKEDTQKSG